MRKFAFLTLGLSGLLLGTPSCGKDEATGDGSGDRVGQCGVCEATNDCQSAYVCKSVPGGDGRCANRLASECCTDEQCYPLGAQIGSGGSGGGGIIGGSGGTSGRGGGAGRGGTGSGTFMPNTSFLGAACNDDDACQDSRLICVKNDDLEDGSGPPNGICTLACETDGACLEFTDSAYCVSFGEESYCLEGCFSGPDFEPKCHQRTDFACALLGLTRGTTTACEDSNDCGANELCGETGFCGDIITACMPTCGGDFHCGAGQFCDFTSGLCVAEEPTGLSIGSACDPRAAADPCDGFCSPTNAAGTQGKCAAFCSFGASGLIGCGWDGTEVAEAACLYDTILSPPSGPGANDLGICGQLCDCNDQCRVPNEYCVDEAGGTISGLWNRNGYCRPLQASENVSVTFDECPDGSSGGAGGQSGGGGGGNAGEGGSGEPAPAGAGGEAGASQGGQGGA